MKQLQVNDGIQVFKSNNNNKLIIRSYSSGKYFTVEFQQSLYEILLFLKEPRTFDELKTVFNFLSSQCIDEILSFFIEQKIVRVLEKDAIQKKINILVVGVGTTGGFTVEALCRNNIFKNLILVDPDIVEISNLHRQVYLEHEIGEYKAQALKNRFPQKNIKCYKQFVSNLDELLAICLEEEIDLIVQCADKPSSKELCRIVTSVCNILEKPCILNYGYLSNVIALPEFYYPNNTYNMDYRHDILDEELILSQILEKSDYTVSIQASFVIAEQIKNYIENKKPIYYQYRGYFSIEKLKWEVEKIE